MTGSGYRKLLQVQQGLAFGGRIPVLQGYTTAQGSFVTHTPETPTSTPGAPSPSQPDQTPTAASALHTVISTPPGSSSAQPPAASPPPPVYSSLFPPSPQGQAPAVT